MRHLLYIFDYDQTLKNMNGKCPSSDIFIELIHQINKKTGLPMVILTAGSGIGGHDLKTYRPVNYLRHIGVRCSLNTFDLKCNVAVFDNTFNSDFKYPKPVINRDGKKSLGAFSYHIRKHTQFNPDFIFFDDLYTHSIESNTRNNYIDPYDNVLTDYILVKEISPSISYTNKRIAQYIDIVKNHRILKEHNFISGIKIRGVRPILDIE